MSFSLARRDPIDDEIIEAVATRAWSPHKAVVAGPWLLRASEGYSHSGNAVAVLGEADRSDLDGLIEQAEAFYAAEQLPAMFELTAGERHRELTEELLRRGYVHDATGDTVALTVPLRALRSVSPMDRDGRVLIADAPTEDWIDLWWSTAGSDESLRRAATELLWDLSVRCGFAAHMTGGEMVATGLGVLEGPWLGMFCIGTRAERRRRGSARRIVGAMATWGIAHAAQNGYAKVPVANKVGLQLFETLGFTPAYHTKFLRRPE